MLLSYIITYIPCCFLKMVLSKKQAFNLFQSYLDKEIDQKSLIGMLCNISGQIMHSVNLSALLTKLYKLKGHIGRKRGKAREAILGEEFSIPTHSATLPIPSTSDASNMEQPVACVENETEMEQPALPRLKFKYQEKQKKLRQQQYICKNLSRKYERTKLKLSNIQVTRSVLNNKVKEINKLRKTIQKLEDQVKQGLAKEKRLSVPSTRSQCCRNLQ